MIAAAAAERIRAMTGQPVVAAATLGGGCIAPVWRVRLADGTELAAKLGPGLALEARMLGDLAAHAPAPHVVHVDDAMLLMRFIPTRGAMTPAAERHLAQIVADLHDVGAAQYGYGYDTVIGGLPQPNPPSHSWLEFFRDHRLLAMADAAREAGTLPASLRSRIDTLAGRLERWIATAAPPALIHGDLWGGNILVHDGRIAGLIDPALYHADPEIELAFMTLFGTVGQDFFAAYGERHPLRPDFFAVRRDLYNLYPLLVHVRLFGGSYVGDVARIVARFAGA